MRHVSAHPRARAARADRARHPRGGAPAVALVRRLHVRLLRLHRREHHSACRLRRLRAAPAGGRPQVLRGQAREAAEAGGRLERRRVHAVRLDDHLAGAVRGEHAAAGRSEFGALSVHRHPRAAPRPRGDRRRCRARPSDALVLELIRRSDGRHRADDPSGCSPRQGGAQARADHLDRATRLPLGQAGAPHRRPLQAAGRAAAQAALRRQLPPANRVARRDASTRQRRHAQRVQGRAARAERGALDGLLRRGLLRRAEGHVPVHDARVRVAGHAALPGLPRRNMRGSPRLSDRGGQKKRHIALPRRHGQHTGPTRLRTRDRRRTCPGSWRRTTAASVALSALAARERGRGSAEKRPNMLARHADSWAFAATAPTCRCPS
mmetsp:Transcript_20264/g.64740  ORF Transcript_20264/g.64740 Transcript_20264/m.64740 type:complete len:379 (+) Transcript_20264:1188-2324(+)